MLREPRIRGGRGGRAGRKRFGESLRLCREGEMIVRGGGVQPAALRADEGPTMFIVTREHELAQAHARLEAKSDELVEAKAAAQRDAQQAS